MGQYHKPCVVNEDNEVFTAICYDWNSGAKLMEHSYIGNDFVNAVMNLIDDTPCKVAWVGDYSDDDTPYMEELWGENREKADVIRIENTDKKFPLTVENCDYYLVNETKGIYIDLHKYVENCKWHESYTYDGKTYDYDMCINPLPLLTATSNGRGGGDYYKDNVGYEDVGTWAWDIIYITKEIPTEFYEEFYEFRED